MRACDVAMEYRNKFGKDVLIDLVCFRRRYIANMHNTFLYKTP